MKKSTLVSALLAVVLFTACSDDFILDRREDRLIGDWRIEKAFYRENGDVFRENVLDEYENDVISFFRNYEAQYDDVSRRELYGGNWELILDRGFFDDEDDREFFLDLIFFDRFGRPAFDFNGEVIHLTNERLHIRVNDRSGTYLYKLRRLF